MPAKTRLNCTTVPAGRTLAAEGTTTLTLGVNALSAPNFKSRAALIQDETKAPGLRFVDPATGDKVAYLEVEIVGGRVEVTFVFLARCEATEIAFVLEPHSSKFQEIEVRLPVAVAAPPPSPTTPAEVVVELTDTLQLIHNDGSVAKGLMFGESQPIYLEAKDATGLPIAVRAKVSVVTTISTNAVIRMAADAIVGLTELDLETDALSGKSAPFILCDTGLGDATTILTIERLDELFPPIEVVLEMLPSPPPPPPPRYGPPPASRRSTPRVRAAETDAPEPGHVRMAPVAIAPPLPLPPPDPTIVIPPPAPIVPSPATVAPPRPAAPRPPPTISAPPLLLDPESERRRELEDLLATARGRVGELEREAGTRDTQIAGLIRQNAELERRLYEKSEEHMKERILRTRREREDQERMERIGVLGREIERLRGVIRQLENTPPSARRRPDDPPTPLAKPRSVLRLTAAGVITALVAILIATALLPSEKKEVLAAQARRGCVVLMGEEPESITPSGASKAQKPAPDSPKLEVVVVEDGPPPPPPTNTFDPRSLCTETFSDPYATRTATYWGCPGDAEARWVCPMKWVDTASRSFEIDVPTCRKQ